MLTAPETFPESDPAHSPDADAHQPIDMGHLSRYTMNDRALECEILDLFAQTLAQTKIALKQATDVREWAMAAHSIKGSARAVGAWKLAKLMEGAEGLKQQPPTGKLRRDILTDLDSLAKETTIFIATLPNHS